MNKFFVSHFEIFSSKFGWIYKTSDNSFGDSHNETNGVVKKTKRYFLKNKINEEKGQGFLEYTLVVFVTAVIFFAVVAQFNKSVEVWLNNYFGEYLSCLLETGELPTLGSTESGGVCAQYYSPFVADLSGHQSNDGPAGENGGDGSGSGSSDSFSDSKKNIENSTAGRGAVESNSRSSSSGKFGHISKFRASTPTAGGGGSNGKDGDQSNTGSTNISTPEGLSGDNGRPKVIRMDTKNLNLGFSVNKDEKEEREKRIAVAAPKEEMKKSQRSERFPASKPVNRQNVDSDTNMNLGFGDYLRFLLIAAIIIAIILFFGGQALQISKSMD